MKLSLKKVQFSGLVVSFYSLQEIAGAKAKKIREQTKKNAQKTSTKFFVFA